MSLDEINTWLLNKADNVEYKAIRKRKPRVGIDLILEAVFLPFAFGLLMASYFHLIIKTIFYKRCETNDSN